jgi:NTE family protein
VTNLREWLSSGPFTLAMSSGFFGFFAHAGFMSVLEEEELLPARVCGSSAGALVAGLWAAGLTAPRICDELLALRREQFWDVAPGLGLLRGALFRERLRAVAPVTSFDECRVPLAVSVFDVGALRTTVLDAGELVPAMHASCAVPLLFQPVRIGRRLYLDGGILDRPGLLGAGAAERVLFHHLTSRSPWRTRPPQPPQRALMQVVAVPELPTPDPFHLERGAQAMEAAARGLRLALSLPIEEGADTDAPPG